MLLFLLNETTGTAGGFWVIVLLNLVIFESNKGFRLFSAGISGDPGLLKFTFKQVRGFDLNNKRNKKNFKSRQVINNSKPIIQKKRICNIISLLN